MLKVKELKKYLESYGVTPENMPNRIAEFKDLNHALKKGWQVWAECEKAPRTLDSGRHYFQIFYLSLDKKGNPEKRIFWVIELMDKNRDTSCRGYAFSSRAIGMSRVLAATDHVFNILKNCGGEYKQLE